MSNVWRTDIREDTVRLEIDSQLLFFVIQGLRHEAGEIRDEITGHEYACGIEPTYCKIRYQSLVDEYGSIEEAVKETGVVLYDCLPDLAEMYTTLGKLMATIHKADQVMKNPEAMGEDPDMTDWRPADKLRELKLEATYREEAGKTETGLMEPIVDDEKSILGLTENLPTIGKDKKSEDKVS